MALRMWTSFLGVTKVFFPGVTKLQSLKKSQLCGLVWFRVILLLTLGFVCLVIFTDSDPMWFVTITIWSKSKQVCRASYILFQFQGRTGKLSVPYEATKHGSLFVVGRFCCWYKPRLFDFMSTVFLLGYQYMVMFRNSEKSPWKMLGKGDKRPYFLV